DVVAPARGAPLRFQAYVNVTTSPSTSFATGAHVSVLVSEAGTGPSVTDCMTGAVSRTTTGADVAGVPLTKPSDGVAVQVTWSRARKPPVSFDVVAPGTAAPLICQENPSLTGSPSASVAVAVQVSVSAGRGDAGDTVTELITGGAS